jgi:hypothetical protein
MSEETDSIRDSKALKLLQESLLSDLGIARCKPLFGLS